MQCVTAATADGLCACVRACAHLQTVKTRPLRNGGDVTDTN